MVFFGYIFWLCLHVFIMCSYLFSPQPSYPPQTEQKKTLISQQSVAQKAKASAATLSLQMPQDSPEKAIIIDTKKEKKKKKQSSKPMRERTEKITSAITHNKIEEPIVVHNNIQKKDLKYYKYFMNHYPSQFTITVNGIPVESDQSITIPSDTKQLVIIYFYEWNPPWGKVTGTKEALFQLNEPTKKIDINFTSWNDDCRVSASPAQLISNKELSSTKPREFEKHIRSDHH
jgi:hypothetical protein